MNETWWVKQEQLDAGQQGVIDLPLNQSHLIVGPPGSGKTNLLLLRGSQMVRSKKPNVLILTFTRTLREFIATGGQHYAFSVDNVKTLNRWHYEFLREHGVAPATDKNFEIERKMRLAQIQEIVKKQELSSQYDAIILDEAQDYLAGEIDLFFALGEVVFAAADMRQHIYPTEVDSGESLKKRFAQVHTLKHHYRNGKKICTVADELAKGWNTFDPLSPTCMYDERRLPSSVSLKQCADLKNQLTEAIAAVEVQLKAYPDELIGILCASRLSLKQVWLLAQQSSIANRCVVQSAEDGYVAFEPDKPVCICTIHGSKGLEFRAVHMLDCENIKKSSLNRHIAYTGITRTKTSLSFFYSNSLPAYLESALSILSGPAKQAKLADLFGGLKNV